MTIWFIDYDDDHDKKEAKTPQVCRVHNYAPSVNGS